MVFDLIARARRAADARDRDARLPGDPDRHRIVPLLRASRRGRSTSAASALEAGVDPVPWRAASTTATTWARLKLFGAVLSAMQIDPTRPHRDRLSRPRDGAGGRRHLRRHRRADQPAADRQGDPGGRLLQAGRRRRVPRQHALEGRHRHRRGREGVRRRRPQERRRAARSPAPIDALQKTFVGVERVERRADSDGRRCSSSTSRRARPPTTSSRACAACSASGASATPARSIRRRAACWRWSSAARLGWRIPERQPQAVRGGRAIWASRPTPHDAAGTARSARSRPAPAREEIDAGARRFPRHVSAAAPGVLGEEDRRQPQLQAGAGSRRRARATRRTAAADAARPCRRDGARHRDRARGGRLRHAAALDCSAGFYVRSLAHDLGERARRRRPPRGSAAHAQRRASRSPTRCLDAAERDPTGAPRALSRSPTCCRHLPSVVADGRGGSHVPTTAGRRARPRQAGSAVGIWTVSAALRRSSPEPGPVRLLDRRRRTGRDRQSRSATPGLLHPSVVMR